MFHMCQNYFLSFPVHSTQVGRKKASTRLSLVKCLLIVFLVVAKLETWAEENYSFGDPLMVWKEITMDKVPPWWSQWPDHQDCIRWHEDVKVLLVCKLSLNLKLLFVKSNWHKVVSSILWLQFEQKWSSNFWFV